MGQLAEKEREILVFREKSRFKSYGNGNAPESDRKPERNPEVLEMRVFIIVKQGKLDEEIKKIEVDSKVIKFELKETRL